MTTLDAFWDGMRRSLLASLEARVPPASRVLYVDYPLHRNVGDLLIYLGTSRWMERSRFDVLGRWHFRHPRRPELSRDTVILCHGGGNLGDLYPHQGFREDIARRYRRNRIVLLPQTLHFEDRERAREAARVFNEHPDLHVMLRDDRSLERAKELFPNVSRVLSPDMSILLYPLRATLRVPSAARPAREGLCLARRDLERSPADDVLRSIAGRRVGEWDDLAGSARALLLAWQVAARIVRYSPGWLERRWRFAAERAVVACARTFLRHERIVTSRLHGHILASLLGVPNTLLDNSYGKNSAYFDTWHSTLGIATLVRRRQDTRPVGAVDRASW